MADFQTCISVPLVYMVKDMGKDFRKWETLKVLLIKLMLVDINVVLVRCLTYLLVLFLFEVLGTLDVSRNSFKTEVPIT